jgi:DNA ligase-1
MNSTYEGKLTEGYFKTRGEAETEEVILPMLAKSYDDESKKIDWKNAFVQPKLDGQRCLAIIKDGKVTLKSRDGKVIENMKHIIDSIESNCSGDMVLDGELYAHGKSFQDNMRLIKKYRPGETETVQYHIYDVISGISFGGRREYLKSLNLHDWTAIEEVETFVINSHNELKRAHEINIEKGYEGSIVRWGDEGYKMNGRSSNLLKFKDFQDITATIINIEPAEQRPEWGVPVLKYSQQKMSGVSEFTFRAGMKYSHEERKEFLKNKKNYIGKTAEVRFFEYSEDGIPRFPVMVGIRLDK